MAAFGLTLLFVFLWSTGFVAAALVAPYAEPLSILVLRFAGAALLLFCFGLIMRGTWPKRVRASKIVISGAFIHGIYLSAVFWGVKEGMPAGISALLVGFQPLLTALFAGPILGEQISLRHWLALFVGLFGLSLVVSPKFGIDESGITLATIAVHLLAVLGIVLGSIFQKKYIGTMNFKTEPGFQLLGGLFVALPIALFTESFTFIFTPELIIGYLWMTLVLSCFAFTLYMVLLERGGATQVASVFYLVPAFAALESYFLFGDRLTVIQLIGMVVTMAAVAIVSNWSIRRSAEATHD